MRWTRRALLAWDKDEPVATESTESHTTSTAPEPSSHEAEHEETTLEPKEEHVVVKASDAVEPPEEVLGQVAGGNVSPEKAKDYEESQGSMQATLAGDGVGVVDEKSSEAQKSTAQRIVRLHTLR